MVDGIVWYGYMWIWVDAVDVGGCSDRWNYVVANAGG